MADIAINDVVPRDQYVSTGGETDLDYTFPIFDADHLLVQETDPLDINNPVTLVRGVDYDVTDVGAEAGGTIVFKVGAYPTGAIEDFIYTLSRQLPYERLNDYQFSGDFESGDVNSDFDTAIMMIQQLARDLKASVRLQGTDQLTELPIRIQTAADRANRVFGFNEDGDEIVAGPLFTDIETVGDAIAEIIIVSNNIASVVTVATNIANVNTVAGAIANVNAVGGSIANVNTVATDIANVNAVAGNATNINAVAGNATNINTVAGIATNINTVAGISAAVSAVAAIDDEVIVVAGIAAQVVSVAANATNINTVAGISANVTTVAGISGNVTTVAGIAANVTTVAGIAAAVSTVASNIVDIQNAEENANIAKAAGGFTYTYDTDTTNSNPGSGLLRFNNATLASATALYISETTGLAQAIAAEIASWDDSTSTVKSKLRMFKQADPSVFAIFNITGTITDNGAWDTVTVAYVSGAGSFADNDVVTIQNLRTGDQGAIGPSGSLDFSLLATETAIAQNDYVVINDTSEGATSVNKMLVSDFLKSFTGLSTVTLALGDEFPFYDISGAVSAKATLQAQYNTLTLLTAETALAVGDEFAVYDVSASTTDKTTVQSLFNAINVLTAETAPATGDKLALIDVSASNACDSITLDNFFKVIASLTSVTAPAIDDVISMYDTSGTVAGRMRFDDYLKVINLLTEDTAPDLGNDFGVTYDASATTAKKVKINKFGALQLLSTATASASSSLDFALDANIERYRLEIYDLYFSTTGVTLYLQISTDNGATWINTSGTYNYVRTGLHTGGSVQIEVNNASDNMTFRFGGTDYFSNLNNEGMAGDILIHSKSGERLRGEFLFGAGQSGTAGRYGYVNGVFSQSGTTKATNIRLTPSTGTFTAGVVKLYGERA